MAVYTGTTLCYSIYVSIGDEKIEIENYVGKNYLEVKGNLEAKGLSVIITRETVKDTKTAKQGVIIKQSVAAGEKLNARDTITLTIPDLDDTYPNWVGTKNVDDVQAFCDEHDVTLKIKDGTCDKGVICTQSRPEGYTVRSNTVLEITVGADLPSGEEEEQGCNPLEDVCE